MKITTMMIKSAIKRRMGVKARGWNILQNFENDTNKLTKIAEATDENDVSKLVILVGNYIRNSRKAINAILAEGNLQAREIKTLADTQNSISTLEGIREKFVQGQITPKQFRSAVIVSSATISIHTASIVYWLNKQALPFNNSRGYDATIQEIAKITKILANGVGTMGQLNNYLNKMMQSLRVFWNKEEQMSSDLSDAWWDVRRAYTNIGNGENRDDLNALNKVFPSTTKVALRALTKFAKVLAKEGLQ